MGFSEVSGGKLVLYLGTEASGWQIRRMDLI
jgi:hypothetical protein